MKKFFAYVDKHSGFFAGILLTIMVLLSFFSMYYDSAIMDEVAHVPAGYSYDKYHDYRLNPEHPPLAKALSGVPLLFQKMVFPVDLPDWSEKINGQWEVGWKFLYERGNDPDTILLSSRIPMLLIMVVLGIYLYLWTKKLFGRKAAVLAMILFAFSPNLIAHSRFVTTDIAATLGVMMGLYHFVNYLKKPTWSNILIAMVALSVAQLLKFSCFVLYPMMGLILLFVLFYKKKPASWLHYVSSFVLMCLGSLVIINLVYLPFIYKMPVELQHETISYYFPVMETTDAKELVGQYGQQIMHTLTNSPITRPFAYYLLGLFMVFVRVTSGNTTYFLGETSNQSWWYFYPVAIAIKTPIVTLLLTLGALIFSVGLGVRFGKKLFTDLPKGIWRKTKTIWNRKFQAVWNTLDQWVAIFVIVLFVGTGIVGNLNIGLRHMFPMYPFWFMLIAGAFVLMHTMLKGKVRFASNVVISILVVLYVATNLMVFPHYLAYFNELIGGPQNGYKYMVDSNLDWGQDLRRLTQFVDENNIDEIKVDYFGGGDPHYYLKDRYVEWHANDGKTTGWIAVSATYFQNSKYYSRVRGEEDYSWLEAYEPEAIIGHSILVYNINK